MTWPSSTPASSSRLTAPDGAPATRSRRVSARRTSPTALARASTSKERAAAPGRAMMLKDLPTTKVFRRRRGNSSRSWSARVQAVLDRVTDKVTPVVQLQLVERVLHMVLHRAVGQYEPLGDLLVGHPGADHPQYLGLPLGEPRCIGSRVAGQAAELAEH